MAKTQPVKHRPHPAHRAPRRPDDEDLWESELLGQKIMVGQMWIPLDSMIIDDRYQRGVTESRAVTIAKDWSQALAGLITVSARNSNVYAILDGQHRARALRIRRADKAWCEVFFDLTPQMEAHIFRERNRKRVPTNALGDLRAALAEGDPKALRIVTTLDQLGLGIAWKGGSGRPTEFSAVVALSALDDWNVLKETLTLIRAAWADQTRAKEKAVLLAVGMLVYSFKGQIDVERFGRVMSIAPLTAWYADARSLRATLGKPDWQHLARILLRHYSKGLHMSGKLAEEELRVPSVKRGARTD